MRVEVPDPGERWRLRRKGVALFGEVVRGPVVTALALVIATLSIAVVAWLAFRRK